MSYQIHWKVYIAFMPRISLPQNPLYAAIWKGVCLLPVRLASVESRQLIYCLGVTPTRRTVSSRHKKCPSQKVVSHHGSLQIPVLAVHDRTLCRKRRGSPFPVVHERDLYSTSAEERRVRSGQRLKKLWRNEPSCRFARNHRRNRLCLPDPPTRHVRPLPSQCRSGTT